MGKGTLTIWRVHLFLRALIQRFLTLLSHDNRIHKARFARTYELTRLLSPEPLPGTLLVGTTRQGDFLSVAPTKTRRELGNMLVVAPTRGGKGLLAVSQLLTWKHPVVVNDIKGDLFTQTAGYRRTLGPVFVIDPTGIGHRFDPLHNASTEDQFFSASSHLLFQPNEGEGRIFTDRAILMLTQMLLAARLENFNPFPYVRHLIRLGLNDTASRLNTISSDLATQFLGDKLARADLKDRFLLSSWGTLTARMRPLLTETLICSLTNSSFTPEEIIRSPLPITVYFRWPERDLLALSPLVRLLWGALIDGLITTYDQKQGQDCHPVLLLVDEAGRTAIPMLADHATTVVGREISLWVAVQSLYQLEAVYGRARAHVLRDNMETQLYYRPSDQDTADHLERALGRVSEYAHSHTKRQGAEDSLGLSEQGVPLMTAGEIKQMKDADIIAFHRNLPPIKLKRLDWRQNPHLIQKRQIKPPHITTLPRLSDIQLRTTDPLTEDIIDPDRID